MHFSKMKIRQASVLPAGRHLAANIEAKRRSYTHLFGIDDDISFLPDAFEIMASRKVPFIAANYVNKNSAEKRVTCFDLKNQPLESQGKSGIEKVYKVGFGLFLLNLGILDKIPLPHFDMPYLPEEYPNGHEPEDYYFCKKLHAAGIPVYVDHDVSQGVRHWGDFGYGEDSYASR